MRNLLRKQGKKRFNPGTAASMLFLNATDPATIKLLRKPLMIDWGYRAQRLAQQRRQGARPGAARRRGSRPPRSGKPPLKAQVIHFINKPMPGGLPKKTARALLDIEDADDRADHPRPGEGDRGLGRGVLLPRLRLGAAVRRRWGSRRRRCSITSARRRVLPPGYLCCGYPQTAAGDADKGQQIITDNRVLFHRVANTLNYLDIKTVIVSCGTCMDQLREVRVRQDLPRLPAARHPRVPDGEGRQARRRATACATCTTTPATRR